MLMIRLQRVGRKHEPVFRLVLTDSKNGPKSGKFLEILGNYDARRGEKAEFKTEKIKYWMAKGANLSNTVHNILIDKKVIEGKKINALSKKTPQVSEKAPEAVKADVPAEAPVADSAESSVEPKEVVESEKKEPITPVTVEDKAEVEA
jgi:small subunit ribosomal protein S16